MNNIKFTCGAILENKHIDYKHISCPVTFDHFHIYAICHKCGEHHQLKEKRVISDINFAMKRLEQEIHKIPAVQKLKCFRDFLDFFMKTYINQTFQITIESYTNHPTRKKRLTQNETDNIIIYNKVFELVRNCMHTKSDEKVIEKGKEFFSKYPLEDCSNSINEISEELHNMAISDKDLKPNVDTIFKITGFLNNLYLRCYHSATV